MFRVSLAGMINQSSMKGAALRSTIAAVAAAALGVSLSCCGGSTNGSGAASPGASSSGSGGTAAKEHEVRDPPAREASCGGAH